MGKSLLLCYGSIIYRLELEESWALWVRVIIKRRMDARRMINAPASKHARIGRRNSIESESPSLTINGSNKSRRLIGHWIFQIGIKPIFNRIQFIKIKKKHDNYIYFIIATLTKQHVILLHYFTSCHMCDIVVMKPSSKTFYYIEIEINLIASKMIASLNVHVEMSIFQSRGERLQLYSR